MPRCCMERAWGSGVGQVCKKRLQVVYVRREAQGRAGKCEGMSLHKLIEDMGRNKGVHVSQGWYWLTRSAKCGGWLVRENVGEEEH